MDKGQDETSAGKHHDLSNPKNGQEAMNHFAHMYTCIHKANIFFSRNQTRQTSKKWGKIQSVLWQSRVEASKTRSVKGQRSRHGGEPRLSNRTLGA